MGFYEVLGVTEVKENAGSLVIACIAELLGNFFLNLFGTASTVAIVLPEADATKIALAFGFTIFVLVCIFGDISGGHFNPAVTVSMVATLNTPIIRGILYILAQFIGSISGSLVLKAVAPSGCQDWGDANTCPLGATLLNPHITPLQGLIVEIMLGFILLLVVCGVTDPNRSVSAHAPLAIGMTIFVGHLASIDYTGSSMNPARTFGSGVVSGKMANIWIYFVGPPVGGLIATFLYKFVFSAKSIGAGE